MCKVPEYTQCSSSKKGMTPCTIHGVHPRNMMYIANGLDD